MSNTKENWGEFREGSFFALWSVAKNGYEVRQGITPGDTTPRSYLVADNAGRKIYPMLGNKSLHRRFAQLDPSNNNDIVHFANRYGLLTAPVGIFPPNGGKQQFWGVPLSIWENEITNCGILLTIWEMIQKEDFAKLGQIILWRSYPGVRVFASFHSKRDKDGYTLIPGSLKPTSPMTSYRLLADKHTNPDLLKRWKFGEVIEPALFYLRSQVNDYLKGQFGFQLWAFDDELSIVPNNLKAAIWLMFAYEITHKLDPAQCLLCGEWFRRTDKRQNYCSKACVQKAYRERKKRGTREGSARKLNRKIKREGK
jgi:hypothetical protein